MEKEKLQESYESQHLSPHKSYNPFPLKKGPEDL